MNNPTLSQSLVASTALLIGAIATGLPASAQDATSTEDPNRPPATTIAYIGETEKNTDEASTNRGLVPPRRDAQTIYLRAASTIQGVHLAAILSGDEIHPLLGGDEIHPFRPEIDDEVVLGVLDELTNIIEGHITQVGEPSNPLAELRDLVAGFTEVSGLDIETEVADVHGVRSLARQVPEFRDLVSAIGAHGLGLGSGDYDIARSVLTNTAGVRDSHDKYANQEVSYVIWLQVELATLLADWAEEGGAEHTVGADALASRLEPWTEVRGFCGNSLDACPNLTPLFDEADAMFGKRNAVTAPDGTGGPVPSVDAAVEALNIIIDHVGAALIEFDPESGTFRPGRNTPPIDVALDPDRPLTIGDLRELARLDRTPTSGNVDRDPDAGAERTGDRTPTTMTPQRSTTTEPNRATTTETERSTTTTYPEWTTTTTAPERSTTTTEPRRPTTTAPERTTTTMEPERSTRTTTTTAPERTTTTTTRRSVTSRSDSQPRPRPDPPNLEIDR